MKNVLSLVAILLVSSGLFACAKKEPPSNLHVQRSNAVQTVAMVEGINLKKRIVTLRSLEGRLFTVHVDEDVVNLPQVKKGDRVEIAYAETLEVRMAEPGEVINESGTYMERAEPGEKPAGMAVNQTSVTATILALDKANASGTLKFADGSVASVKVENPENLDKVKVGDTIVITYLEAMEIKVTGKK